MSSMVVGREGRTEFVSGQTENRMLGTILGVRSDSVLNVLLDPGAPTLDDGDVLEVRQGETREATGWCAPEFLACNAWRSLAEDGPCFCRI
jgi:hypothetical protein